MIILEADGLGLTDDDRAALQAITDDADLIARVGRIRGYWADADRAARTPRAELARHLALMHETVDQLLTTPLALDETAQARVAAERAALRAALEGDGWKVDEDVPDVTS